MGREELAELVEVDGVVPAGVNENKITEGNNISEINDNAENSGGEEDPSVCEPNARKIMMRYRLFLQKRLRVVGRQGISSSLRDTTPAQVGVTRRES